MTASHRRLMYGLAMLAAAALACITTDLSVQFDPDGSGSGVVSMEMLYPADLSEDVTSNIDDVIADLTSQGWEQVAVSPAGAHYRVSAIYPFGEKPGEKPLQDVLPEFHYTIEEAENEYKYFTFEGTADFSEFEAFWQEVTSVWAVEGIQAEETDTFFEGGEEIMSAAEVREIIDTYGEPSASIRVTLPGQTPVDANPFWDNEEEYLAGQTDTVIFSWEPGKRSTAPLKVVRRLEPISQVSEAEAEQHLEELFGQYENTIPAGSINWTGGLSGNINNLFLSRLFHGGNYTCSDYQGRVLQWLDAIRTSPDENIRSLLDGLDYGPIQTNGGGHRAVVIYRRGTDWRTSGTVLDPWPRQKPAEFPIGQWADNLWFTSGANQPEPDEDAGKLYPHLTGETSSYPASAEMQGDLARGLAAPTRVLLVRSPVTPMITFPDGRRIGSLPDGSAINELPGEVDMYSFPNPDLPGGAEWVFFLPESGFEVEMTGTGAGDFHVVIATPQGAAGYGGQPISPGESASFSVDPEGDPGDLALPGGKMVPPEPLDAEALEAALGLAEVEPALDEGELPAEAADEQAEAQTSDLPLRQPLLLAILCLCVVGGVVGFGLIGFGLLRRRRASST